ncbi:MULTISPECIES: hypothetical protein [unclassified Psychrobacter]|uniref:hypothetical protein n=1 Tax=unclassified Psychrobacter TaxID=196806 RepID=UPI003F9758FC
MFKNIRKFSKLSKSQKIHIILFLLFISFLPTKYFLEWRGRGFPQESQLNYSTGILEYTRTTGKRSRSLIILEPIEYSDEKVVYGCSYTAITSGSSASCLDLKSVEPYLGKHAVVGWYDQPSFLGFKNDTPQLVTLKIDDKHLKTYDETFRANKKSHVLLGFVCLFLTVLYTFIFIKILYPKDVAHKKIVPKTH